jgi:ADP-heptose:LPS heptosyltransferase
MDILFVTATRIGDAVLSTGLLGYLVERHRGARFTIAAGPLAAPLFTAVPGLERLLAVPKERFARHWLRLFSRVAGRRWDLVVDLRGSALAWLLRAGERRVMAKGDPREHRVRQLARLFDLDPPPAPMLWTSRSHDRAAETLIAAGEPVLALAPAAAWRGKEWRPERFAELAMRLTSRGGPFTGGRIAVLGGTQDRTTAAPLLAALPRDRIIDLIGRTDLLTAAAVLRRCALFVGNASGLLCIAAAVDIPTLGLFGPTPIEEYAPWGPRCAVVRTELPPEAMFGADFDHRTTGSLMDSLTIDMAEAAACDLMRRLEEGPVRAAAGGRS